MATDAVTPEDVLEMTAPANGFLCPLEANVYDLLFLSFSISDYDTKRVLFEVGEGASPSAAAAASPADVDGPAEDALRTIKYDFNVDVLRLPTIATSLKFSVGDEPLSSFMMIERHFFRDTLVKSYSFEFGFCPPRTVNTWSAVYDVPPLESELVADMVANPYKTTSDSFYFVKKNDQWELIMHNKALYRYVSDEMTTTVDDESKM